MMTPVLGGERNPLWRDKEKLDWGEARICQGDPKDMGREILEPDVPHKDLT